MAELILVTGGARSGKSDFAAKLALRLAKDNKKAVKSKTKLKVVTKIPEVIYLATGQALDEEMKQRIALHKKSRPKTWQTIEAPLKPEEILRERIKNKKTVIIFDCLTLFLSNLVTSERSQIKTLARIKKLTSFLNSIDNRVIVVTNEVGLGIVPVNKLARNFRDLQGRANCIAANAADQVYLLVCGQALKIK